MADETKIDTATAQPVPPQGQQIQVPIDNTKMESLYINFFQVTSSPDEVFLDAGTYVPLVTPTGPEPVHLTHRLVMNFVTAKKLAEVLRVVVARHEQAFGVVEVDPARRLRGGMRPQG